MKKFTFFLLCLFLGIGMVSAQTRTVTGTVISEDDGEPIIGASIVVKGNATTGTITDYDGNFSISVPNDAKTLVVSYIGMLTQEVAVSPTIRVVLKSDMQQLDEVVVTAMGITREKKALGYASQGIKTEELTQTNNTSLAGAMQGKVSGLQITPSSGMPGASSRIVIRGARSFTGNNTPLYVVDGMPITSTPDVDTGDSVSGSDYSDRAVDIDPSNIESIEVLKGQAAAALYGIRASNGVIIITTKSGKGVKKGKPQITVNSSVSFEKPARYFDPQTKYAQGSGGRYNPTSSSAWGPLITELPNDATYGGNTDNAYTQQYGKKEGMYYVPQRAAAGMDPWQTPQVYDNGREFFNTGTTYNNSVNVAQTLDKGSYSLFLGAANQEGIVPSAGMDRYTAGFNSRTQLSDNWSTGFTGNYINSKITKVPSANSGLLAAVYGAPASYDLKGIPAHIEGNPYVQNHFRGGTFEHPYWGPDHNRFEERMNRFFGNTFANYETKFHSSDKKLNVKYQLGVDTYSTDYINAWGYGARPSTSQKGEVYEYNRGRTTVNSLLTANFNWQISDDFNLSVIAGNEYVDDKFKSLDVRGNLLNFAGWDQINNATNIYYWRSSTRKERTVGFFGEITAAYKNMLYLGVTGRQDYVSHMPRNNRSFFYPSVNGSIIFTELDIFEDNAVLDFGKFRASYAEVGQAGDYYNNYYYKPTYSGGWYNSETISYPINGVTSFIPYPDVYDPGLKPQNTRSFEVGIDATFFKNLFDISYTYSNQNVKDQIFDIPMAGSTGLSSVKTNGGKMETQTHEVTLNVNPVRTKLIDWNIGVNWTKITNMVKELAPGVTSIMLGGFTTPQIRAQAEQSFPVIYGVDYERDKNGNPLVYETGTYAGMPIPGETTVIGNVSPDFMLGINTKLRIQKLTASAVFDWKSGGKMYHGTYGVTSIYGVRKDTENRDKPFIFDGYKSDGTKNDIEIAPERLETFYNVLNGISTSSVVDADFFKLREISLSYPVYTSSTIEVGVNAFARNIILWTKMDYFDPEASQGNNNMGGGFERFSLPTASSYGFGLNVKF